MKKLISLITASAMLSSITAFNVNAKVIEPEIVKTETWTSSYYIDDDIDTLYPYIDCQADIYSDGTVKCYFWNTHEWDGFATVSHTVTLENSIVMADNYINNGDLNLDTNKVSWNTILDQISYYPSNYISSPDYYWEFQRKRIGYSNPTLTDSYGQTYFTSFSIELISYSGALPKMPVNKKYEITFTPTVDPVEEYNFRFLGHDFIVTPEILSGSITSTPQLSEQEEYIKSLEKEIETLKEENARLTELISGDSILRCDTNDDGVIDAVDASTILSIYAINSTGGNIKTLTEYKNLKEE